MIVNNSWLSILEDKISYKFKNSDNIKQALTHKSSGTQNYERLEFLGDAIWRKLVAEILFLDYPNYSEHQLTILTNKLVNTEIMAECSRFYELPSYLVYGDSSVENIKESAKICCDIFEAFIAAIYLDGGTDTCINIAKQTIAKHHTHLQQQQDTQYKNIIEFNDYLSQKLQIADNDIIIQQDNNIYNAVLAGADTISYSDTEQYLVKFKLLVYKCIVEELANNVVIADINAILDKTATAIFNAKNRLQEYLQKLKLDLPIYMVESEPDNSQSYFVISCSTTTDSTIKFFASATTKKDAEHYAAQKTLIYYKQL